MLILDFRGYYMLKLTFEYRVIIVSLMRPVSFNLIYHLQSSTFTSSYWPLTSSLMLPSYHMYNPFRQINIDVDIVDDWFRGRHRRNYSDSLKLLLLELIYFWYSCFVCYYYWYDWFRVYMGVAMFYVVGYIVMISMVFVDIDVEAIVNII